MAVTPQIYGSVHDAAVNRYLTPVINQYVDALGTKTVAYPTTNPNIRGALWLNGGVLCVS
jgi:hypothetical protein